MKKVIIIGILTLIVAVVLAGCIGNNDNVDSDLDNSNNFDKKPKSVTMNIYEYGEDQKFDIDISSYFTLYQQSVDEGDTLLIKDNISSITYDSFRNQTNITICHYIEESGEYKGFCETFRFQGNLTNEYQKNDLIMINVTIKHVVFSDGGFKYDLEIYNEQWVDEKYFNTRVDEFLDYQNGFKPMSPKIIIKIG